MSWQFDKPLITLSDAAKVERDKALWEAEDLGTITEDNNRVPVPVVFLVVLTVLTAFAITFPLWGQRPNAAIYQDYVKSMDAPEVVAIQDDNAAMKKIEEMSKGSKYQAMLVRHPISMDELRLLKPKIEELQKEGKDLADYNVIGANVVLANFEGNHRADGSVERQQPWWDKGYVIDIFYVIYFFSVVTMTIKRLPPSSWQPRHGHEHI